MDAKSEPAGEAEFDSLVGRWRGRGCGDLDLDEVGTGPGVGLTTRLAPFEEGLITELVLSTKGDGSGVGLIEFREPALTILLGVVSSGRHARHHIPNLHPAEIYADGPLGRLLLYHSSWSRWNNFVRRSLRVAILCIGTYCMEAAFGSLVQVF